MDHLTITDLTEGQFVSLLENISHRVALHQPLQRLWQHQKDANCLRITTRFSDKKNPSARIAYATRLPLAIADVRFINLLWLQDASWFLLEIKTATEVSYHQCNIPASSAYKANALTMQLDTL